MSAGGRIPALARALGVFSKPTRVLLYTDPDQSALASQARELLGGRAPVEVRPVPAQAKYAEVLRLLNEALQEEGGAIVFCARQKTVEEVARLVKDLDCALAQGALRTTDRCDQDAPVGAAVQVEAARLDRPEKPAPQPRIAKVAWKSAVVAERRLEIWEPAERLVDGAALLVGEPPAR